jgi:N-formylglutamate amidohydrolase
MCEKNTIPSVIIHMPHASRYIPKDMRDSICLNNAELEIELDKLTDHYTDELFSINNPNVALLKYPFSRYVADPERFPDESLEVMAEQGQGVIYTKTVDGKTLRESVTNAQREQLLSNYYWPHHKALDNLTKQALEAHGHALIVDCHSFPSSPLPVDLDQNPNRADICIGTDINHTPSELVQLIKEIFIDAGYSVAIDEPYAGTIVPTLYYNKDNRVKSVMIEINRRLYLKDEPDDITKKEPDFTNLQALLKRTLLNLIETF